MNLLSYRPALLLAAALAACGPAAPQRSLTGLWGATEIDVASKIPGRVKELSVREGDVVKEGQRLVTIESQEIEARVAQATAAAEAAQARLELARRGARPEERDAARRALDSAQSGHDLARKTAERLSALLATGSVTQAQFDEAQTRLDVARDQLAMAESRYQVVLKGARPEELRTLEALVAQGRGAMAEAKSYGAETTQTAPLAGTVSKLILHKGELASTGFPILTLVDLGDVWVTFPVREDLLPQFEVGRVLHVQVPALGREVEVKVFNVAALGDFATWRATNEKAGFDLKSFEVKARPTAPVANLRPGMTARWLAEK